MSAVHRPCLDDAAVRLRLGRLCEEATLLLDGRSDAAEICRALGELLLVRHGFSAGNEDGDELADLLADRRGSEEVLVMLWLIVGHGLGLRCESLAFPLQPLVRLCDGRGGRAIVDCGQGVVLDSPALRARLKADAGTKAELEPRFFHGLGARDALLRRRQAVKMRRQRLGDLAPALAVVESALLFAPDRAGLWREAGLMRLRLNDLAGAAAALEQFVLRENNAVARGRGRQLLAEVRARMN